MKNKKIVAYVMTKNEEATIGFCIDNLQWCDEIIVGDTGSSDRTREIAKGHGAVVIDVPFKGFGPTRNQILSRIESDWVVCFDADEFCTPALAEEIKEAIKNSDAAAFLAPRKNFLFGSPVHHSGWYPDYRHPVAFNLTQCYYDDSVVHERLIVEGKTRRLSEPFAHYSYGGLLDFMAKNKKYAVLGAEKVLNSHKRVSPWSVFFHSTWAFVSIFFLKLGFLDGWNGFVIASSSSYSKFFRYGLAYQKQEHLTNVRPQQMPYSLRD